MDEVTSQQANASPESSGTTLSEAAVSSSPPSRSNSKHNLARYISRLFSTATASQQANASPESAGTIQPVMSSPPPYNAQPSQSHPPLAEYSYIKLFVVVVSTFAALCFVLVLLTERAVTIGPAVVCLSLQGMILVSAAGGLFDVHTRFRGGWNHSILCTFFLGFLFLPLHLVDCATPSALRLISVLVLGIFLFHTSTISITGDLNRTGMYGSFIGEGDYGLYRPNNLGVVPARCGARSFTRSRNFAG
ncbi:hypothetical protein BDZ89DRAFT_1066518 [Hymenopellis radicata]|nr:hypothetical protein BDZ89DRAFT_1066518 [Hymenopellis radicata]